MLNPIKRLYKPKLPSRTVSVSIADPAVLQSATCEVIEYDSVAGIEQWNDSVFIQDFEDSVLTAPVPPYVDSKPANQNKFDVLDPFSSVGKNSA